MCERFPIPDFPPTSRRKSWLFCAWRTERVSLPKQLIYALLSLARVSRQSLALAPVDLSALARTVASHLSQRDPDRAAEVQVEAVLFVQGDAALLRVLLENLVGNAWKFTAHQRPARIEVGRRRDDAGEAIYFVRDNGVGFDMAYAHDLFGPFRRLHSAPEFPGTGIGLATVKRIVERHGGRVWAEGMVDAGATFFFTIGLTSPNANPPSEQVDPDPVGET